MKSRKMLMLFTLIFIICCSINAISALELTNDSMDEISHDGVVESNSNEDLFNSDITIVKEDIDKNKDLNYLSNDDNSIYVGHNNKTEGGNGTYDNPYTTIKSAWENAHDKDSITIKIYNGTYRFGEGFSKDANTPLKFDTNNLNIIGINGSVTITNYYWDDNGLNPEWFALTSSSANLLISNIIFEVPDNFKVYTYIDSNEGNGFLPFVGTVNSALFENCTFKDNGYTNFPYYTGPNTKFINCKFDVDQSESLFNNGWFRNSNLTFEYCIMNINSKRLGTVYLPSNVSMKNMWFGSNSVPGYISGRATRPDGTYDNSYSIPLNRYAQFSVSENYLGNNQYEIIGKLTWNGTNDQEGMENFQPMTVKLSSNTGSIDSTAILKNGEFRTIYTSTNSNHKITATLDNEEIELEFNNVNISVNSPSISYGDNQNVTLTFTQPIAANVTVTVSNESYRKNYTVEIINKDSITYTIPDTLKAGTYTIDVNLADKGLYGSNSTELKISKVVIDDFSPELPGENPKVGDNVTISVELPEDATGTVTVYVNDKPFTKEASTNTEITVNGLIAGDNNITVEYSGNDKYETKSIKQIITADKLPVEITNNTIVVNVPAGTTTPEVSINIPGAEGNLTVIINNKTFTEKLENGTATVTIKDVPAGTYNATVIYSGDDKFDQISTTAMITVSEPKKQDTNTNTGKKVTKAATKIVAKKKTFKAKKKVKKYTITLKSGKKPVKKVWVTLKIKGKKLLKAKTNAKGKATFKIKKLTKKGKYNAVIKFKGNKNYKASSKKVKITIKK